MFYISIIISTEFSFMVIFFFYARSISLFCQFGFRVYFTGICFPLRERMSVIRKELFKKFTIQIFATGIFYWKSLRIQLHTNTMLDCLRMYTFINRDKFRLG